ncbi:DUF3455 domain-containing protein [Sphingomonas oryzagri]|uniref:DUF3455 domain-containing protein n=1 Tax=Sphingomonas oryzagri TaxID=3042314 RepID=A0ABT6MYB3_9SPHN|nr:DUF3455 domain-containing protein [Sphingomonas oryzagri]MDH7637987.1 DUF3455 domain-containing protein [Sphingomonas oryzagri]
MLPLLLSLLAAEPFDVAAHSAILSTHAEGAQLYECKAAADGALHWVFREPIATLIVDGRTVGRHYAGPKWALDDGSVVQGKMVGTTPGATAADIPELKLQVVDRHGDGRLKEAAFVYRLHTKGGVLDGTCAMAGALQSAPYSADYVFTK